jgi:hypothetical protein
MSDEPVVLTGVAVTEFAAAVEWWTRLFSRGPDILAHDNEVLWRVTDLAWVYVVRDDGRAGRALLTMSVGDLDTHVDALAERDISCAPIELVSDAGRKASCSDPDGNLVTFVEVSAT